MAKLVADYEYSDAELLALLRSAYATVTVSGQSYSVAGRTWTASNIGELQKQITWLEDRVDSDNPPAQNFARMVRR